MKEAQYMSETVLYAEAKMGKLLKGIPPAGGGAGFHKKKSNCCHQWQQ